ncbi:minichromosome maintenance protein MCM [Candidatus Micrarchaeota archaeon]|nr:minichromosome maintenance protein MCM [Candidatus Micrarchaeota archaeon]
MVVEELVKQFTDFFESNYDAQLRKLAQYYPQQKSLIVDFQLLARFNPDLAEVIKTKPDEALDSAQEAVKRLNYQTLPGVFFKPYIRLANLDDSDKVLVQYLGAEHLDNLSCIEGVVTSIGAIAPRMRKSHWKCLHCESTSVIPTDKIGVLTPPPVCLSAGCGRRDFKLLESESEFVDMQSAQVQDLVERSKGNAPASHVDLWLEEDLTNTVAPGDKVILAGMLRLKPLPQGHGKNKTSVYSKYVDVVHVQKMERDFEEIDITAEEEEQLLRLSKDANLFDKIISSIAPSIYGFTELKSAIALQLFGGTPSKVLPDGEKIRSDMHVLLIGDPGTAKSTILEYVNMLAPKSVLVSGGGTSAVGLTASAEKDELTGGWTLKAGAMVLANGGMVLIDEFDKMREEDRGAIHQAMEQQKISVAKAGIVTEFQAKTSVLSAANPKLGRFDPNIPLAQQFNIAPALLSRFDLIFTIKDILDEAHDRKMAEHILTGHTYAASKNKEDSPKAITPTIAIDFLRKYIAYARRKVSPELTPEAKTKIRDYYVELRKLGKKQDTFTLTPRQIEALVRISEASAKMRLSQKVELVDAQRAVDMVDFVLKDVFVDRETGKIDSDVISTGRPKSKTDKVRSLLQIINSLEKTFDVVSIPDVLKEASAYAIEEMQARSMIEELKRQGDLYEPKAGFIKTSKGKQW